MNKEEKYTAEDLFRELEETINGEDTTVWITVDGNYYHKEKGSYKVWWLYDRESRGERYFTFDFKTFYGLFRDYPAKLSKEEKEIFDKENPFWADYVNAPK